AASRTRPQRRRRRRPRTSRTRRTSKTPQNEQPHASRGATTSPARVLSVDEIPLMRIALLAGGDGWHVRDLARAATLLGHQAETVDFRRVRASVAGPPDALAACDGVIVRTMPPGSLEQVVFRMDVLHRLESRGVPVLNPARALEVCVDKCLATARLEAAGLPVPPTAVCQDADSALEAFAPLGGRRRGQAAVRLGAAWAGACA